MGKVEQQTSINAFGLNASEEKKSENIQNYLPVFKISELDESKSFTCTIIDAQPREFKFFSDKSNQEEIGRMLNVKDDLTNMECQIGVNAKSLSMQLFRLFKEHGTLTGLKIRISVKYYKHEKFGKTKAYIVTEIK